MITKKLVYENFGEVNYDGGAILLFKSIFKKVKNVVSWKKKWMHFVSVRHEKHLVWTNWKKLFMTVSSIFWVKGRLYLEYAVKIIRKVPYKAMTVKKVGLNCECAKSGRWKEPKRSVKELQVNLSLNNNEQIKLK